MSADYSVPNCPWCGMASQSKPEHHHEWETVHMECGSEIYPPRATTPSQQSEACKIIASTTADRDALRAEVEALRHEVELTNEHEHQILTERNEARAELERTKEELENARNALEEAVRVITSDNPAICDTIWTGRPGETLLDHLQAALERKDGAIHG